MVDKAALETAVREDHTATIECEWTLQQPGQLRILPLCERRSPSLARPLAAGPRGPCAQDGACRQSSDDLPERVQRGVDCSPFHLQE